MLHFFQFHPPGDLLRRPSHGKAVLDVGAEAGGALDPRSPQPPRPGPPVGGVGAVAVHVAVSRKLPVDRAAVPAQPACYLVACDFLVSI